VGTTICAQNNLTGAIDFSGTDAASVINSAIAARAASCGKFFFKGGKYPFSSVTQESTGGYSNWFYEVAFPPNAGSSSQYCQWIFEGEQASYAAGTATQASGTIFQSTAAARTAAGAGHELVTFWARPDVTNNVGNDLFFRNIAVQAPDNQRGNECAFCLYEAGTANWKNVMVDIATPWGSPVTPAISPAVEGANRMIAFQTTKSSHNNWESFEDTWAIGWGLCYDVESEHSTVLAASAALCNDAAIIGRVGASGAAGFPANAPILHPGIWHKWSDQENINGVTLGPGMGNGSYLEIRSYDMEILNSSAFARVNNLTETNKGYTSGQITYSVVLGGVGLTNVAPASLFNSGGGVNFSLFQGNAPINIPNPVTFDSFTHPNGPCSSAWINIAGTCTITSNNATGSPAGTGLEAVYQGQSFGKSQFSRVTLNGINANGHGGPIVLGNSAGTFYRYECGTTAVRTRAIQYYLNNVFQTTLASSTVGCNANGDVLELDAIAIPGSSNVELIGYYNDLLDFIVVDGNITSGSPGLNTNTITGLNAPSLANWSGGSLPTKTGVSTDSIYSKGVIAPVYLTLGGPCAVNTASPAACGSASNGVVVIPTTTTTYVVNTLALTPNSTVILTPRTYVGNLPGSPTCVAPAAGYVGASVALPGLSFTITLPSTAGTVCMQFEIRD
jgi:hypothetical protein